MRLLRVNPAIPNSVKAALIQVTASARTFGAFCLPRGSYAVWYKNEVLYRYLQHTLVKYKLQRCLLGESKECITSGLLQFHIAKLFCQMRYAKSATTSSKYKVLLGQNSENPIDF